MTGDEQQIGIVPWLHLCTKWLVDVGKGDRGEISPPRSRKERSRTRVGNAQPTDHI